MVKSVSCFNCTFYCLFLTCLSVWQLFVSHFCHIQYCGIPWKSTVSFKGELMEILREVQKKHRKEPGPYLCLDPLPNTYGLYVITIWIEITYLQYLTDIQWKPLPCCGSLPRKWCQYLFIRWAPHFPTPFLEIHVRLFTKGSFLWNIF